MRVRSQSGWQQARTVVAALLLGALATSLTTGCAAWGNYPAIGEDGAINDPNVNPMPSVIAESVRWVVRNYPVEGAYVINLPGGMERKTAERILTMLNDPNARLVAPENRGLPVYHVAKIWVRESRATVDVFRPVRKEGLATTPNRANYQLLSVKLVGGPLRPAWRVESAPRAWPIGAYDPPILYGWDPQPEAAPEAAPQ